MVQARRARCPSHTTIRTLMPTTSRKWLQAQTHPNLFHLQNPNTDPRKRQGRAILDKAKGATDSAHTTIVNAGEDGAAGGVMIVGEGGEGDVVARTDKDEKDTHPLYHVERKIAARMVIDHSHRPLG
jgi:hypothetical protein